MSQVKNVVFDVGRVLIDFSYERLIKVLHQQGAKIASVDEMARRIDLIAYEHGRISNRQFLQNLNGLMQDPLPESDLVAAWTDLFTRIDGMFNLAASLMSHCGVYLMSNTSEIHWQYLLKEYELEKFCHGLMASYEVGVMKPDPKIFQAACDKFGLHPSATLFIDDMEVNVKGARACGWQGIHHQDVAATCKKVADLTGVEIVVN